MSRCAWIAAVVLTLTVVSAEAAAQDSAGLDEQAELDKGRNAYLARQYDEADDRFRKMLDPKEGTVHDPVLINQARMYWGAVLVAKKHVLEASDVFKDLLRTDRYYEPDPLTFPTDVVNVFIDTRSRIREELNAKARDEARKRAEQKAREDAEKKAGVAYVAMLEQLAGQELTTVRHSRWVALLPFGVGQFQNGQPNLGWFFLSTEGALVLASAISLPIYLVDLQYRSEAARAGDNFRAQEYIDRANTVRTVNLVMDGSFAALAIAGAVQAEVTFVPQVVELQRRTLPAVSPATPSVSFSAAPLGGGMIFGASGRF